ncbi:MAG: DUF4911 domain-containing protein [Hyphomicrobiales bacterium]
MTLETTRRYYRCRCRDVAFLRFAIEACDGIAFLRTLEPGEARVVLHVPPGCEKEVDELMRGLQSVVPIEELPAPNPPPGRRGAARP